MRNAALGAKRKCLSCGAAFFDLRHDPIVCPRCKVVFVPVSLVAAPYVRKLVLPAEPVPEPEPELADDHAGPNDDDEEDLEVGGDEGPDQDEPAEEQEEDPTPEDD